MVMPAPSPEKRYKNRPDDTVVINLSLDRETARLLREHTADHPKGRGRFVGELIRQHVRQEGLLDFVGKEVRRELKKVAQQVVKDVRRQAGT